MSIEFDPSYRLPPPPAAQFWSNPTDPVAEVRNMEAVGGGVKGNRRGLPGGVPRLQQLSVYHRNRGPPGPRGEGKVHGGHTIACPGGSKRGLRKMEDDSKRVGDAGPKTSQSLRTKKPVSPVNQSGGEWTPTPPLPLLGGGGIRPPPLPQPSKYGGHTSDH